MRPNLRLLLGIALLFGISTGIYEIVLPLFLRAHNISFEKMGVIFALAGLAMVIARIYMGGLADRWGRKPLYGWALVLCGGATGFTPFSAAIIVQVLLKTVRDIGALTRETVYPVILYEEGRQGFLNRIGKFRGVEFLMQAGGTLLTGLIFSALNTGMSTYRLLFLLAGGMLILGAALWVWQFHEPQRATAGAVIPLRDLFSFDLHPNLRILLVSGLIFTFGMQLSHSFFLQLFFLERFPGATKASTAWIMVAHRLTIALPLLVVGNLPLKNYRAWYIAGLLIEGAAMAGAALLPAFKWSVGIFLLHDLIGAGIWSPIQATLIQRYSRDASRGMEVGKVLAWSSLGVVFGPLAAGVLADQSPILPFLASGIVMALSAIPLCWLNARAAAPAPAVQVTAPAA